MKYLSNRLAVAGVAALALGFSSAVYAVPCGTGGVGGSVACFDGPVKNDNEDALNDNSAFGFNTWEFLSKDNWDNGVVTEEGDTALLTTSLNDTAANNGTWSIDSALWATYDEILVVLKDGGNEYDGTNAYWSAYQLGSGVTSGWWDYNDNSPEKAISHISIYGVKGTVPFEVVEPASLAVLGLGLLMIPAVRRRG